MKAGQRGGRPVQLPRPEQQRDRLGESAERRGRKGPVGWRGGGGVAGGMRRAGGAGGGGVGAGGVTERRQARGWSPGAGGGTLGAPPLAPSWCSPPRSSQPSRELRP